ncbi:MAG: Nif3-like dinuclear metal center hexameric protein, partial [Deltaproteobacteria bacterium]
MTIVADVIRHLEAMAPEALAERWDNCGLQVGALDWPVQRIWVSLDPLPEVVSAACRSRVDLLVTHHPLIFKPLVRIDAGVPIGRSIADALAARLAVYAAHTSYDSAPDGLNDVLARRLGVTVTRALAPAAAVSLPGAGLGRIGTLAQPMVLEELARDVCRRLGLVEVRLVGDPGLTVHEAALCSGSGGSLTPDFLASPAQVYITGEIHYHQARDIAAAGRGAIDIGHFGSERIMIADVTERLARALADE